MVLGIAALVSVRAWVKGTALDAPLEALGLRLPLAAGVSAFPAMEVAAAARPNPRAREAIRGCSSGSPRWVRDALDLLGGGDARAQRRIGRQHPVVAMSARRRDQGGEPG